MPELRIVDDNSDCDKLGPQEMVPEALDGCLRQMLGEELA
jgi:hypothetical protein